MVSSVFDTCGGLLESQCPELENHDYNDKFSVNPGLVQALLLQPNPMKSMRPDRINLRVFKDLAVITRSFSMILEWSQESEKVPVDWNLINAQVFQKARRMTL